MEKIQNEYPVIGVLVGWHVYGNGRAVLLNYLATLLRGIRAAARHRSCNLLLACGINHSLNPISVRPAWPIVSPDIDFVPVGPSNTDGLIIINPLLTNQCLAYTNQHLVDKHPTVFIGNTTQGTAISIDNAAGIRQALSHLAEHGHRQIAFIAGQPEDVDGDSRERLNAYLAAVRELGLEENADLIAYGHHVVDRSELAMERILARDVPFTAVLGSSDECAIGAINVLQRVGKRVPHDVAVIGFDDLPEAILQDPPLTTIHSPTFERGQRAVDLLLDMIVGKTPQQKKINVSTRLILRQSCGCSNLSTDYMKHKKQFTDCGQTRETLTQAVFEVIQSETRRLSAEDVQQLSQMLVEQFIVSLEQQQITSFDKVIEQILQRVVAVKGNTHCWQMAISLLSEALPFLLPKQCDEPHFLHQMAEAWLTEARIHISEQVQRQLQQNKLNEHAQAGHMGRLTAGLLSALDESEIFATLKTYLPPLSVDHAVLALFQPREDDPYGWSYLRTTAATETPHLRIETKTFPPAQLYNGKRPYSLALLPLIDEQNETKQGFIAFDTGNLALCGAILQQLVAALKTTQLYREAEEGRRLAEEANRLKSRFLSTVSHELRTPLSLIVGLSNMVLYEESTNIELPQTFRDDLERIYASAQHLDGLIRDVLDLAQTELGQLRLSWDTIDLSEVVRLSALVGEQLVREKDLNWHADIATEPVFVRGDRTRLQQVILNLLHNAVKFTQQGTISLSVAVQENLVTVFVRDTGLGIDQEEQAVIFNEFRRSERAESGGYGGLGIGLTISKRIITLHGGDIHVHSSGQNGEGSLFYFTLPRYRQGVGHVVAEPESTVLLLAEHSQKNELLYDRLTQQGVAVDALWLEEHADEEIVQTDAQNRLLVDQNLLSQQDERWAKIWGQLNQTVTPPLFYSLIPEQDQGALLEFDYLTKPMDSDAFNHVLQKQGLADGSSLKTILIVDDEPAILDMHVRIVATQREKYRILTAENGRIALEIMQKEIPDLLLLDLMMPEVDGFAVLEAMRAQDVLRTVPVVVLTAQLLTTTDMARLSQGVATVLNKGLFTIEETIAHIEKALTKDKLLGQETQRLVRQAMAYIHEQYMQPLTREDIARYVGVHHDYLTRCFSQETAVSPVTYLNRYRIIQAKKLLKESDLNMTEVAITVGFSSSSYFSRTFRRETGISPSAYKRQGHRK